MHTLREAFRKFAQVASLATGNALAFLLATFVVVIWAATGPIFRFSDTWQLVINTGTTVVTFLMVFLIQNTQNRDSQALHAKLDELLIHNRDADNHLVEAEDLSDKELEQLKQHFQALANSVGTGRAAPRRPPMARRNRLTALTGQPVRPAAARMMASLRRQTPQAECSARRSPP